MPNETVVLSDPRITEIEGAVSDEIEPDASSDPGKIAPEATASLETEPKATEPETETVYATRDVNIRQGPGTDYEKIGQLEKGEAVERIRAQEDGWSQIIYNDEVRLHSFRLFVSDKATGSKGFKQQPVRQLQRKQ